MHLYLTGFMGSGKTTVGGLLAEALGLAFVDLDTEIERAAGATVREIFDSQGEDAFRALETRVLAEVAEGPAAVVATGGGVVTRPENIRRMRSSGVVVWLHPAFDTIARRIGSRGKTARPLFTDETAARALYRRRLPAYGDCDLELPISSEESPEEVAARAALVLTEKAGRA
jgi:shikimate kinase